MSRQFRIGQRANELELESVELRTWRATLTSPATFTLAFSARKSARPLTLGSGTAGSAATSSTGAAASAAAAGAAVASATSALALPQLKRPAPPYTMNGR
mgnify:CR=1 FL=1